MLYSCCATMEHYDRIISAGYDRIILPAFGLCEMEESDFQTLRHTLENGPVQCRALNDFCSAELKLCGPEYDRSAVIKYSRTLVERSRQIGVEYIGVGAPRSRNIPDDYPPEKALAELKDSLTILCHAAAICGINILLEAVCSVECNFITSTDAAFDIVASLGLANLHLVFDTYHASMMGENAQPLLRAMQEVRLVHVAQDIDSKRRCPQNGFFEDHRIYFDALRECGFDGEVGVEACLTDTEGELEISLSILKRLCGELTQISIPAQGRDVSSLRESQGDCR
jgi:D-psicose/D-tagatose/L-ribulose 3-epimerase